MNVYEALYWHWGNKENIRRRPTISSSELRSGTRLSLSSNRTIGKLPTIPSLPVLYKFRFNTTPISLSYSVSFITLLSSSILLVLKLIPLSYLLVPNLKPLTLSRRSLLWSQLSPRLLERLRLVKWFVTSKHFNWDTALQGLVSGWSCLRDYWIFCWDQRTLFTLNSHTKFGTFSLSVIL